LERIALETARSCGAHKHISASIPYSNCHAATTKNYRDNNANNYHVAIAFWLLIRRGTKLIVHLVLLGFGIYI
jgi:hypothetical protein